jgi:hypothetical protein
MWPMCGRSAQCVQLCYADVLRRAADDLSVDGAGLERIPGAYLGEMVFRASTIRREWQRKNSRLHSTCPLA